MTIVTKLVVRGRFHVAAPAFAASLAASSIALGAPVHKLVPKTASTALPATTATSGNLTISGLDGESDEVMSLINIRLDKKPVWAKLNDLQEHGSFLQILLPNTTVPHSGEFFEGNSPYIQKIAAFQLTPSTAGIRLFTKENAAKVKQAASVELLGKRVVVTVDHTQMQKLLAQKHLAPLPTPGKAITQTASPDAVIAAANAPLAEVAAPKINPSAAKADDSANDSSESEATDAATDFAAVYKAGIEPKKPTVLAPTAEETLPAAPTAVSTKSVVQKVETPIGRDEIPSLDPRATAAAAKAADAVIANTEVRRDIPEPATLLKAETSIKEELAVDEESAAAVATATSSTDDQIVGATKLEVAPEIKGDTAEKPQRIGSAAPDLRSRLVQISIFSGLMLILLAGLWLVKPYLRKRAKSFGNEPAISMKTLASLHLAAKQKVSLIQVGDEQILIGVTPENVSFITTIKSGSGRINPNTLGQLATGHVNRQGNQALGAANFSSDNGSFAKLLSEPEVDAFELKPSPFNNNQYNQQPQPTQGQRPPVPSPARQRPQSSQPSAPARKQVTSNPQPAASTSAGNQSEKPRPSGRINVSISDDGITDHRLPSRPMTTRAQVPSQSREVSGDGDGNGQKAIDDVTKMIREKLKNLRSI